MAATTHNSRPRMLVDVFIRPLPDISNHIHYAKWTRAVGVRIHIAGREHSPSPVRNRRGGILRIVPIARRYRHGLRLRNTSQYRGRRPIAITPWIKLIAISLRGVLPLPLMRKPLA